MFEGFYHELAWRHLCRVTCTIYINFLSHLPRRLHAKFCFVGQVVSEMFENNGHVPVLSPRAGGWNFTDIILE